MEVFDIHKIPSGVQSRIKNLPYKTESIGMSLFENMVLKIEIPLHRQADGRISSCISVP